MLKNIFFYTFIVISLINTLHFGFYIVGANIYDILQILGKKPVRQPEKLSKRAIQNYRPFITVIVPAHNEEKGIIRTLESLRKSTYKHIEVIVVDDKSTDKTRSIVWHYIKDHPNVNVKLMRKNQNVGKGEAMNHVLKNGAHGELVMTLDADSIVARPAISRVVRYFANPKVVGVAANVQVMNSSSMLGLLQKFEHMIGYRSKKFYTLTNTEFIIGGVGSTYRKEAIKQVKFYDTDTLTEDIGLSFKLMSHGNRKQRIVYAADVLAMTEGVQTYKALFRQRYRWKLGMLQNLYKYKRMIVNNNEQYTWGLTHYRLPMAIYSEIILLIEPFLLLFILYFAITHMAPFILIGAYLTITAYLLWNLWPDEHLKKQDKIRLSMYSPVMYFVFYVMNAVQLVSIVRCIWNGKQVTGSVATGTTWVSPERAETSAAI